ncbi:MAG: glycosyl hydrolase family 5 [Hyphomicrobium sp.]|nr:glycosyl hydrolase family 5 [Hyphomicrobium sp.]
MRFAPLLAGTLMALTIGTVTVPSQAAPVVPKFEANQTLIQPVYDHYDRRDRHYGYGGYGRPYVDIYRPYRPAYGGRCKKWRNICADRWGFGGPGFGRCMWRQGC